MSRGKAGDGGSFPLVVPDGFEPSTLCILSLNTDALPAKLRNHIGPPYITAYYIHYIYSKHYYAIR